MIDSDYRRKLGTLVLEHADTVVWLDLPLHVCLRRLWRRTRRRMRGHEQLWNGNTESWWSAFGGRDSLFVYAIRNTPASARRCPGCSPSRSSAHLRVVRLRSEQEVGRWLEQVAGAGAAPLHRPGADG